MAMSETAPRHRALQLDGLSDAFTVVAWDAPGAGGSWDPPEHFGMAGYADCLAGFVEALGLESPHVVGLSFGWRARYRFRPQAPCDPANPRPGVRLRGLGRGLCP